jgi:phosphoenolpyruvate carboxylase
MQLQDLKNQKTIKKEKIEVFEAMVTRSLFGNINASRNSA